MEHQVPAVLAAVMTVEAIAAYIVVADHREIAEPASTVRTVPNDTFEKALARGSDGWFIRNTRCTFDSFVEIAYRVSMVLDGGTARHDVARGRPSTISNLKKIAICLNYLASGSTIDAVSSSFGVSKSRGVEAVNSVLSALYKIGKTELENPFAADTLERRADEFEDICGFPDVVGAVDGTLIRVSRPHDHEGWYCRKGYPAVNVQAVVDSRKRFLSCSIRSGSSNDQSLWNRSGIRHRAATQLPQRFHILGDSGYKLWNHLLTPYPEDEALMCPKKSNYNYCHSRTRIVVEQAFGILKNRWRILLRKVEQKTPQAVGKVIVSCMVLHNILVDMNDSTTVPDQDPEHGYAKDFTSPVTGGETSENHQQGKTKREIMKECMYR